jgi:rhodanese-related sulfurtransferase/uncharacterized membrane protein YedE/YeeE
MAPFYPLGLISQEWYLVIIFFIGLFFGLVLEQSGFSSSRKLAGVFYGYDFVVLKVFFTAGVTAMAGLVILGYLGMIELNLIFINSNFIVSAVTGGVIMGFGFIMGGFCPGTSVTGAVIGKIDAMVFIAGIFLGIFVFGSFETTFNKLFTGYYFDRELLSQTFGLSKHLMVFMMIFMALAAFGVAAYFEKRATNGPAPTNKRYPKLGAEVTMAVIIALIILFLPQQKSKGVFETNEKALLTMISEGKNIMSPDELAYLLINNPKQIGIIDVRGSESFNRFHLPGSVRIPLEQVTEKGYRDFFNGRQKKTVLISNGGVEASKAYILLARKGYDDLYVLDGGLNGFVETIFHNNEPPEGLTAFDEISKFRFRKKAAAIFRDEDMAGMALPASAKKKEVPVPATTVVAAGGC